MNDLLLNTIYANQELKLKSPAFWEISAEKICFARVKSSRNSGVILTLDSHRYL